MPLLIKLGIDTLCGVLNAIGGWNILWCRRYVMPILIGISFAIITHTWWIMFLTWPAIGTLSIGYSKDGNFGRALWIIMQAVTLSIGCLLLHHLAWYFFAPYIIFAGILGGLYRNWYQPLGDFITGCWMGLIVFFVH